MGFAPMKYASHFIGQAFNGAGRINRIFVIIFWLSAPDFSKTMLRQNTANLTARRNP
jgi:hypothetical protein